MPQYTYIARARNGEKVNGTVEASDRRAALMKIERLGQVPMMVKEGFAPQAAAKPDKKKKKKAPGKKSRKSPARKPSHSSGIQFSLGRSRRPKMNLHDLLLFTGELSDLLSSGMTLGHALNTLSRRESAGAQGAIVVDLRDEIVQGSSLSNALTRWPETFPKLYISMVRAGEASGALAEALERLRYHYERYVAAREKVITALVYPAIILSVGAGTLVFIMIFVVPRFTAMFEELGSTLPLPTRILMGISHGFVKYWWLMLLAIVGAAVLIKRVLRTDQGERWWHHMQLRLPLMRLIVRANAFAHFSRTLGALLVNGVPVLEALSIVEDTVGNRVIAEEIHEARDRVTDGSSISGPLAAGNIFPPLLTDMLAVGEESGDMSGALRHIAKRYDDELDRTVKILTTVLEPILMLVMALLVGFVAISILLAVFDLTSGLNV
jgi:type II secretory pathway component PulF